VCEGGGGKVEGRCKETLTPLKYVATMYFLEPLAKPTDLKKKDEGWKERRMLLIGLVFPSDDWRITLRRSNLRVDTDVF
jgi:hypothetical protein